MTVDEIRAELLAIRDEHDVSGSTEKLPRARALIAELVDQGLSPRLLGVSLRQLRLNPRAVTGQPRGRR